MPSNLDLKGHIYPYIDNYIYLYHLGIYIILPSFADVVNDSMAVNWSYAHPLSRSAPIYSYTNSGPRSVQFSFNLHRDMMQQINYSVSNAPIGNGEALNDDYVDFFIKAIQATALPEYSTSAKMVNPPVVAVRLGDDIFIKGVISGNVGVTYNYPILSNNKYSNVGVNFGVWEIDPFTASDVVKQGSFRGMPISLQRNNYMSTSTYVDRLINRSSQGSGATPYGTGGRNNGVNQTYNPNTQNQVYDLGGAGGGEGYGVPAAKSNNAGIPYGSDTPPAGGASM